MVSVYAVHTAFSGNHVHYAERIFSGQRVLGGGELLLSGEVRLDTRRDLHRTRGSTARSAPVSTRWRGASTSHLRSRPRPVSPDRPITLNVWEAVYFDHDEASLVDLADRAAELGVERFVLDDGWFGSRRHDRAGLGDWVVSPDVWPQGLHPLVDHVRGLGMEFGLWFEPEMVNPDSDVARAHPEWIMSARREWPVEARHQQVLNLGIPEAYEHVKQRILAIVDEYDIDFIKWDHNRDLIEAGTPGRPTGGRASTSRRAPSTACSTRSGRRTRRLEIESCSSGGGRVDLGVLERTDRVWVSDCIDPFERQHMTRWTAQLIPPELMGAHIASGRSHTTGRVHDLGFRAATAVFGHLGIEWDLAKASESELDELGDWLAFFKAHRRAPARRRPRAHGHPRRQPVRARRGVADRIGGDLRHGRARQPRRISRRPASGSAVSIRNAHYRLRPLLVGSPPAGLRAPLWWGPGPDHPGAVLSGAAIEHVGVAAPVVAPGPGRPAPRRAAVISAR